MVTMSTDLGSQMSTKYPMFYIQYLGVFSNPVKYVFYFHIYQWGNEDQKIYVTGSRSNGQQGSMLGFEPTLALLQNPCSVFKLLQSIL